MKKYIIGIISLMLLCSACSTNPTVSTEQSGQTAKQATTEKSTFGLNEDCFIKNDSGEYKLTITGIEETDYRNEFSDVEAERVVIISYNYENISYSEDLYISDMNFKMYDADGNALENYPAIDITYPQEISAGRKCSAQAAYALNNENNHIELEFYDNMFNSKSDCMFV